MGMSRENAKELLPIIRAFAEGKEIQFYGGGRWRDLGLTTMVFKAPPDCYRIKPESKYRPFTFEEFLDGYEQHYSRRLVTFAGADNKTSRFTVVTVRWDGVKLSNDTWQTWKELLDMFVWHDGTPIGIRTDE